MCLGLLIRFCLAAPKRKPTMAPRVQDLRPCRAIGAMEHESV